MDCRETELLCHRYLDKEITTEEFRALKDHLRVCPRCLLVWNSLRETVDLLAVLADEPPDPELFSRIMMRLPTRGRWRIKPRILRFAAVAAFTLAVGWAGFFTGTRQMLTAAVESRGGRMTVVPQPGRALIIPEGATVLGDLYVEGDVFLSGKVEGSIHVTGRSRPEPNLWHRLAGAVSRFWRMLWGR